MISVAYKKRKKENAERGDVTCPRTQPLSWAWAREFSDLSPVFPITKGASCQPGGLEALGVLISPVLCWLCRAACPQRAQGPAHMGAPRAPEGQGWV